MSFDKAAAAIKISANQNVKMTDDELLQVYSLFKQGTVGDCNIEKPDKAAEKWEAWNKLKGKSKEDAQAQYVAIAKNLLQKYNLQKLIDF